MAEINNTQWLEEYLKMWTPKERMGRIHKVTTFDPTYHCYPEGVYLLDDDCRAHTAIYVVDKEHNVHIIYDGMAWDLLARAVEEGANSIVLQLEKGNKSLADILNEMLKAHNTCCAGLQEKLKRIGDQLERIGNNTDGINGDIKRIADSSESIKDDIKRIADKIDEGGGTITPSKKTLLLAEPDRHKVTEDKKVYTSAITSIVKGVPEQPWTITDDFATYPEWATVSTDKGHVYITTDGSKPGKGKNDPWNIEPEPKPEPNPEPEPEPEPEPPEPVDDSINIVYREMPYLSDITPAGYERIHYSFEVPIEETFPPEGHMRRPVSCDVLFSRDGEQKLTGPSDENAGDWLADVKIGSKDISWTFDKPMTTHNRLGQEFELQPLLHIPPYRIFKGDNEPLENKPTRYVKLPAAFKDIHEIFPGGELWRPGELALYVEYWTKAQADRLLRGEDPKNVFLALFNREMTKDTTFNGAIQISFTKGDGEKVTQTVRLQDAVSDPSGDSSAFCIPADPYDDERNIRHDFRTTSDVTLSVSEPLSMTLGAKEIPLVAKWLAESDAMNNYSILEPLPTEARRGDDFFASYWYSPSYVIIATEEDMKKIEEDTFFTDLEKTQ